MSDDIFDVHNEEGICAKLFDVGDRVIIRSDIRTTTKFPTITPQMVDLAGQEGTVVKKCGNRTYNLDISGGEYGYVWCDYCFEPPGTGTIDQQMTASIPVLL